MQIRHSRFSFYEMSQEEELQSQIFNHFQKAALQNQLHYAALEKNNLELEFSGTDIHTVSALFLARHAELSGQIKLLENLLQLSEDAENTLRQKLAEESLRGNERE